MFPPRFDDPFFRGVLGSVRGVLGSVYRKSALRDAPPLVPGVRHTVVQPDSHDLFRVFHGKDDTTGVRNAGHDGASK